jgi:hypothetical protein
LGILDCELISSVVTIIFVTTMATVLRRFTLWKATRGSATIAQLEQYQASISLPATLKMIVLLRAVNWGSLALVLIWCWYYLGSQAAGREYVYQTSGSFKKNSLVLFANPNSSSLFQGPRPTNSQLASINGQWMAAYSRKSTFCASGI